MSEKETDPLARFYDLAKHLTTLASGSTLLIATFANNFKTDGNHTWLLIAGISAMLLTVLFSLGLMMVSLSMDVFLHYKKELRTMFLVAICSFTLGLASVALFAVLNV